MLLFVVCRPHAVIGSSAMTQATLPESRMGPDRDIIWGGYDEDGVRCCVARSQWMGHVANRPEIGEALDLTSQALASPETVVPIAPGPMIRTDGSDCSLFREREHGRTTIRG